MTPILAVALAALAVAAVITAVQVARRGRTLTDRTLALDLAITTLSTAIIVFAAANPAAATPFITTAIAVSLAGFIATTTIARYIQDQRGTG